MSAIRMDFFSRALFLYDITKQLSRISVKTLIICGKHDVQCPLNFSIEISECIAGARLYVFEDSSHYPFLEEPQLFNKVVEDFFKIDKI